MDRQHSANTMAAISLSLEPAQPAEEASDESATPAQPSDASLPPLDLGDLSALPRVSSSASLPAAPETSDASRKRASNSNDAEAPPSKWPRQTTNDAIALSLSEPQPWQCEQLEDKATLSFSSAGLYSKTPVLEWARDRHQWIKAKEAADPVLGFYRQVPTAVQQALPPLLQRMHSKRTQEAVDLSLQLAGESVAAQLEGTWTDWTQPDGSLPVPTPGTMCMSQPHQRCRGGNGV